MPHKDKEMSNRDKKNYKNRNCNGKYDQTGKYSQKHIRIKLEVMDKTKKQIK